MLRVQEVQNHPAGGHGSWESGLSQETELDNPPNQTRWPHPPTGAGPHNWSSDCPAASLGSTTQPGTPKNVQGPQVHCPPHLPGQPSGVKPLGLVHTGLKGSFPADALLAQNRGFLFSLKQTKCRGDAYPGSVPLKSWSLRGSLGSTPALPGCCHQHTGFGGQGCWLPLCTHEAAGHGTPALGFCIPLSPYCPRQGPAPQKWA